MFLHPPDSDGKFKFLFGARYDRPKYIVEARSWEEATHILQDFLIERSVKGPEYKSYYNVDVLEPTECSEHSD